MPLGTEVGLGPGHIVLDGDPAPPHGKMGTVAPLFGQCLLWLYGRPSQQLLSSCYGRRVWNRPGHYIFVLWFVSMFIMAALCNREGQYFCPVVSFYLFSFFFSSPNLSGRRLDVYHISTHGVALVRI